MSHERKREGPKTKQSGLAVRFYIIFKYRCLSLSSSPSHGPLLLTAGGHSSNLSLWHAVNLPVRDLRCPLSHEPSANQEVPPEHAFFDPHPLSVPHASHEHTDASE